MFKDETLFDVMLGAALAAQKIDTMTIDSSRPDFGDVCATLGIASSELKRIANEDWRRLCTE